MKLSWIAMCLSVILVACSQGDAKAKLSDLPPGNAAQGAVIFQEGANGAVACSSCHRLDEVDATAPSLAGYRQRAGEQVKGQSAEDYTYMSIIRPARHLVRGFSNLMPSDYEEKLTTQQLADLIAYLLTL